MLHIGSLCSGYGGLDMAIQQVWDSEVVWFSEFDKYAAKVFEAHHPDTPNLGDLTKIEWETVPPVDILCAGYPCQPFSHAGNRKGENDERHLWPYIKRGIGIIRPRVCVFENVEGHLTLGFDQVLSDLAEMGYRVAWGVVAASDVGAPHRRNRLFILAYANGYRLQTHDNKTSQTQTRKHGNVVSSLGETTSDSNSANTIWQMQGFRRRPETRSDMQRREMYSEQIGEYSVACERWQRLTRPMPEPAIDGRLNPVFVEWLMGLPEGWVTDHANSPSQALKMLGNGVVPQQAEYALRHLTANLGRF